MAKLIVEMEMPKKERFCELQCADLYCIKTSKKCNVFDTGERPSWCPIKGVLPDEHGDLIDRSLLCADLVGVILSHSGLGIDKVIGRQNAVLAAERKDNDKDDSDKITKAWGQYIEREKVAEKIAVEEDLNRRRRELEEIKTENEQVVAYEYLAGTRVDFTMEDLTDHGRQILLGLKKDNKKEK